MSLVRSVRPLLRGSPALSSSVRSPIFLTPARSMSADPPPRHHAIIVNPDLIPTEFPTLQSKLSPLFKTAAYAAAGLAIASFFLVWLPPPEWAGNLGETPSEKARKAKAAKEEH